MAQNNGEKCNGTFLYVFSKEDMDAMVQAGYTLLKADDIGGVYIFADKQGMNFETPDVSFVRSNTLTF